jgi:hypothetical protein
MNVRARRPRAPGTLDLLVLVDDRGRYGIASARVFLVDAVSNWVADDCGPPGQGLY